MDRTASDANLDAAERLFADHGYDRVTLRHVTQLAGTNIASVNYYFGSKENLFAEIIGRRIRPIDARRLQLLSTVLSRGENGTPQLGLLLDAFAKPFFESIADPEQDERLRRMIARVLMETDGVAVRILQNELLSVRQRFIAAIGQSRPQLSHWHVVFGLVFFSGAMIHLLASLGHFSLLEPDIEHPADSDEAFRMLVRCGIAAFDSLAEQSSNAAGHSVSVAS